MMDFQKAGSPFPGVDFQVNHVELQGVDFVKAESESYGKKHGLSSKPRRQLASQIPDGARHLSIP